MKVGVVTFPGSNCDHDCLHAITLMGHEAIEIWHGDRDLGGAEAVILPGGFSYGDYLRCGAIARFSPIMQSVINFANRGGPVLGICNGFQVLLESGLLPGALLRNQNIKFICKPIKLRLESNRSVFAQAGKPGQTLVMPIAHGDGNYFADQKTLLRLQENDQIVFRYSDENPNGSSLQIAGICNEAGHVVGMMPHPERAMEDFLGGVDGRVIFESFLGKAA